MDETLEAAVRERVLQHVLRSVHPDGLEAEVVEAGTVPEGTLVGVKVHARGYLSTANYALVTVGLDGEIADSEAVTGRELRRRLAATD